MIFVYNSQIFHHTAPNGPVGNDHPDVIKGVDFGGEQGNGIDGASDTARFDEIGHAKRRQDDQHNSRRYMPQGALQREAEREIQRAQYGDKAGGLHAETSEHGNDREGEHRVFTDRGEEGHEGFVEPSDWCPALARPA